MKIDYLSVTMSEESCDATLDALTPILAQLGIASAYEGIYKLHTGGVLKTGATRGPAHMVSASGDFLRALQAHNLWEEYLTVVGTQPHRVTRMDIAQDVACDAPVAIQKFKRRVESGKVSLTRKKLNLQTQYNSILSHDRYGVESGTIYIGPRSVQVAGLRVYDKAKEQYDKFKREMPPTLRWELQLGRKAGLSLRDAYDPDPIFWHYMASVLPAPDGVPSWTPFDGELALPSRVTLLPAESMRRLVESSDVFSRLFALSDLVGAHGLEHLLMLITKRHNSKPLNPAIADGAAVRPIPPIQSESSG